MDKPEYVFVTLRIQRDLVQRIDRVTAIRKNVHGVDKSRNAILNEWIHEALIETERTMEGL